MSYWYYWLLGAMLVAAGVDDVLTGKVRNAITLPAIVLGLVGHTFLLSKGMGIEQSLLGLAVGFGVMFVIWQLGAIGGGDVKLTAAIGALAGWRFVLTAMFFGLCVAVIMAVAMLIWKRALRETFKRLGLFLFLTAARAKPGVPVTPKSSRLPFGTAMCIGCGAVLVLELAGIECRFIWL